MKHIEEEIEVCKRQIEIFSHVLNMYEDTKERLENELRRKKGITPYRSECTNTGS